MKRFDYHNHTIYSNIRLIDSINYIEKLIDTAIELNLAGIAITDHEALCSHPKVIKYMEQVHEKYPDFKVALGNEIYLVDEIPTDNHYHYILLAKDAVGHKQLRMLSSLAWMHMYGNKRVDTLKQDLERYVKQNPGHLIASTACIGGELGKRILAMTKAEKIGDKETAAANHDAIVKFMLWNKELFGDDFYIETQPGISKEQIIVNQRLVSIANCFNVKVTCTSDSHYPRSEDRAIHKAFLNSKEEEREVDAFYADAFLHSNEEMINKFAKSNFDELFVEQMFNNTLEIFNKIEDYTLFHTQQIPKVEVKDCPQRLLEFENIKWKEQYPILTNMFNSNDKIERYWVNECFNKLEELDKLNEVYLSRLEEEADIKKTIGENLGTNIFAYPVVLQHYIDSFWDITTMGAGRGSSCSGLNHYLLGVTQLDPIEWELPFWRYLNKDRAELPDIDIDISPSKRPAIIEKIRRERGAKFYEGIEPEFKEVLGCTLVATFGTETTKSAIQTACRGYRSDEYPDGIDVDKAQFLSSLVPSERGFLWPLKTVVYGDPEKDRKPVTTFIAEVNRYPGLLEIMLGIEGLVSRRGTHASGVILTDEDPFEYSAFMRSPSGEVCTQYDLHDAEWAGITKYDFLVTEIQDKITESIKMLQEYGEIEPELTLREAYDKYLHPNVLPIETDTKTWEAIQNARILNLFQFESPVGRQAAKKIKPSNILELADANGLMRLMTGEDGEEQPLEKYSRFKKNIHLWYDEMDKAGLTKEEQETLKPHFLKSHGVPPSQEQLMTMLMDENICGFSLKDANAARKIVGKKQMNKIPALHEQIDNQAKSPALAKYVWKCGVGPQMGYAFSVIHALAYSFIGFQCAYIATRWNPIYWNTACLVVNSGSLEDEEEEIVNIYEKEDEDCEYEDLPDRSGKKKKDKGSDYAKVAKAIGAIKAEGINLSLVNINTSDYGFKPDIKNNRILYGLKALSNINSETIEKIKYGRPYSGIKDFMLRCPLSKTAMINLIKAGAFDEIDSSLEHNRVKIMVYYLSQNCDMKKKLTLKNFNGLIQNNLIPQELEMQIRVYNFNKYLKAKKVGKYYTFDDACSQFFDRFYSDRADDLEVINGVVCILQTTWDKIYKKEMDVARVWLKANEEEVLKNYNQILFKAVWEKYCKGTTSTWEMDSMCCYHGPHELINVDTNKYGISNFEDMEDQEVDYYFKKNGKEIPIYKLRRIIGTVIAKDDTRHSISLLTTTGVVDVKFSNEYYAMFKRQLSQVNPDGSKTVVEKSWFKRGTLLMVQGFRREDTFVSKNYNNSEYHQLYKIDRVDGRDILIRHERITTILSNEEEYD